MSVQSDGKQRGYSARSSSDHLNQHIRAKGTPPEANIVSASFIKLTTSISEKWVCADQQRFDALNCSGLERGGEISVGCGPQDHRLKAAVRCHSYDVLYFDLNTVGIWINKQRDSLCLWCKIAQELQTFVQDRLDVCIVTPVTLPPGRFILATRPALTGSIPMRNRTGNVVVAALAARADIMPPLATINAGRRLTRLAASSCNCSAANPQPTETQSPRSCCQQIRPRPILRERPERKQRTARATRC